MKRFIGIAVLAALVLTGCSKKDDDGNVSGVFPEQLFVGRTAELVIAGDGLRFSENSVVDLGADVTVSSVEVIGPSALVAYVTIAATAVEGLRDVIVDGQTLTQGVELVSPISVTLLGGQEIVGGLNLYEVTNLDASTPFTSAIIPSVDVGGEVYDAAFVDSSTLQIGVYLDPFFTPAPMTLTLTDGGVLSIAADFLTPAANPVTPIVIANGFDPNLAQAGDVALGSFSLTTGDVLELDFAGGDAMLLIVYEPGQGALADTRMTSFTDSVTILGVDKNADYVIGLHDAQLLGAGPAGQVASTLTLENMTVLPESEPNDAAGTATSVVTLPSLATMNITAAGDVDFFEVDLSGFAANAAIVDALHLPAVDGGLTAADTYMAAYEDTDLIQDNDDSVAFFAGLQVGLIGASAYLENSSSPQFAPNDVGAFLMTVRVREADVTVDDEGAGGNDDLANATVLNTADPVTMPTIIDGNIDVAADSDFFSFTLAADASVAIQTGPGGTGTLTMGDTELILYDGTDTEIASNDDKGFFDFFSLLEMDLVAGTYKVEARSSAGFAPTDTGDYRLTIVAE